MSTEGKQKEENNELDESHEKEKKKNFFQTFLSYFKYEKKLHKKINQSLLFNAYLIILEIGYVIFYRLYLMELKLNMYTFYVNIDALVFCLAGFVPRISSSNMVFYTIMIFLQISAIGALAVIVVLTYFM